MTETFTQSFVLTKDEIEIISSKASSMGSSSNSAALRAIVREWAALTSKGPVTITIQAPTPQEPKTE